MLAAGLRAAQLILLALCAYLLYATVAPQLRAAPTLRDVRLDTREEPEGTPPLEVYASVWKQSPFGKPLSVKPVPTAVRAKVAAVSKLGWRLVTTAAGTPAELSVAGLVSTSDGSRKTVRVGDQLSGREVVDIERRRVVFSYNGALEQLSLAEDTPHASPRPASRRSSSRAPLSRPIRPRLGTNRMPTAPARAAPPPAPSGDELAELFAGQLELEPGEEIVSVNGVSISDPALGDLANDGGDVVVQIRAEDGSQREITLGASQ